MRCTGTGFDDCCPLFDNRQCAEMCSQVSFAANEQNNFICWEFNQSPLLYIIMHYNNIIIIIYNTVCALICEPGQVLEPNSRWYY